MRVKVILGDDGSAVLSVENQDGLSFEQARERLTKLQALLGDLPIAMVGEAERHSHPHDHQHAYHPVYA